MTKTHMQKRKQTGFTFIELLVSATIIIVLSVIGVASFAKAGKSARDSRRRADLAMVQQAMVQYKVNQGTGVYPEGAFSAVITALQLSSAGYLSAGSIVDPKSPTYNYACAPCTTTSFKLTAYSEVTATANAIFFTNP